MSKPQQTELIDPKKFYNLFENELESDVTLLVGQEGWQERVPAHSWVLAKGSDYFKVLLRGPFANTGSTVHRFPDDPKGFNNLIRWLYQNKCDLQSLQSSLDTLSVAIKYLCPELAEHCIVQLTSQLNAENVLKVLCWIYFYCSHYQHPIPSAPSLEEVENSMCAKENYELYPYEDRSIDPTISCHILLNECLDLIDKQTDAVLSSEHICTVDLPVLQMILKRDTLNLSSELKILKALHKWATAACKREQLPLTLENKRKLLGPNLYLARLLTLSPAEIETLKLKNKENVGLLTDEEIYFLVSHVILKDTLLDAPKDMRPFLNALKQPRNAKEPMKENNNVVSSIKHKKKIGRMKRFNKKEMILDLVSILGLIFD